MPKPRPSNEQPPREDGGSRGDELPPPCPPPGTGKRRAAGAHRTGRGGVLPQPCRQYLNGVKY